MIVSLRLFFVILMSFFPSIGITQVNVEREWTVMIYMNAKNNLEEFALSNFHSMAKIGSSEKINLVAQLGRPSTVRYTDADGNWSGVYRFYIRKNDQPLPTKKNAVDVKAIGESTDMGSPKALQQFINWTKRKYPAKRYMVVIWNHGQGWRFMLAKQKNIRMDGADGRLSVTPTVEIPINVPGVGGFRAVSSDDDTGSILYNREVQDVIAREFNNRKLDLLGYDACLMAMLETAYGLTSHVDVMVGSEELEPGTGWKYSTWLDKLVANPTIQSEPLASLMVESYKQEYENEHLTTLSAIRLSDIRAVAAKLSTLSNAIKAQGNIEIDAMRKARSSIKSYGASTRPPLETSVDLITLLKFYEKNSKNKELQRLSSEVRASVIKSIIANYASTRSQYPPGKPYGSEGLAIYFPESADAFYNDYFHSGYLKNNADRPVDFVQKETWADLLYKILGV